MDTRWWNLTVGLAVALSGAVGGTFARSEEGQSIVPLPRAHAHNDYYHRRPLLDALQRGFCSVEADIFLVDGKLLVGHSQGELKPDRTLEALYLSPLAERIEQHGGHVFKNGPTFTLLVDIKSDGPSTYRALHETLRPFAPMLTRVEAGQSIPGPVGVIVSGNRPVAAIAADDPRYVGIDGRLSDLASDQPSHLLPMISDNWRSHFRWRGVGPMPEAERGKLHEIVKTAHAAGRRVRFWATPESPALWRELREAEVDLINTDRLDQLSAFLREMPNAGH